jgi:chromosome segregation ATPase
LTGKAQAEFDGDALRHKVKKLEGEIKNLLHDKTLLEEELKAVSEKLDDEVTKHKTLAKDVQEREAKHKATLITCKLYESENDRLQRELLKKGDELQVAHDRAAELKNSAKILERKCEDTERRMYNMSDKLAESESGRHKMALQLQGNEDDLRVATAKLAVAESMLSALNVVRTTDELEKDSLTRRTKELERKNELLQDEYQFLEGKLNELRERFDVTQRMLYETRTELNAKNVKLQTASGRDAETERANELFQEKIRALEDELRTTTKEQTKSKEQLENELHKKTAEARYLNNEVDTLKRCAQKDAAEKKTLVEELELMKQVAKENERNKQHIQHKDAIIEDKYKTLESAVRDLQAQKLDLLHRLHACEEELVQCKEDLNQSNAELRRHKENAVGADNESWKAREKVINAEKEMQKLRAEKVALEEALKQTQNHEDMVQPVKVARLEQSAPRYGSAWNEHKSVQTTDYDDHNSRLGSVLVGDLAKANDEVQALRHKLDEAEFEMAYLKEQAVENEQEKKQLEREVAKLKELIRQLERKLQDAEQEQYELLHRAHVAENQAKDLHVKHKVMSTPCLPSTSYKHNSKVSCTSLYIHYIGNWLCCRTKNQHTMKCMNMS